MVGVITKLDGSQKPLSNSSTSPNSSLSVGDIGTLQGGRNILASLKKENDSDMKHEPLTYVNHHMKIDFLGLCINS